MKREIKHPRKIIWAMRDFINEIHELTYEDEIIMGPGKPDETIEEWFERLSNATVIEARAECVMIKNKKNNFFYQPDDERPDLITIGYNLKSLEAKKDPFYSNFIHRCPMAKGFARITIILFHELGHASSAQYFEGYNRSEAIKEIRNTSNSLEEANEKYFKLPDEVSATEWAMEWLSDPENRKIAKRFEKKFFSCYKKRA